MVATRTNRTEPPDTRGFGVPTDSLAPHHFVVEIPRSTRGQGSEVRIYEDLGMQAQGDQAVKIERVAIPRAYWSEVATAVKRTFNERLKAHSLRTGTWKRGGNPVDRLLGKELCVLGWALEDLEPEYVGQALRNWLHLRPEERWWLFGMVVQTQAGEAEQTGGWRTALRYALGHSEDTRRRSSPPVANDPKNGDPATSLPLFDTEEDHDGHS